MRTSTPLTPTTSTHCHVTTITNLTSTAGDSTHHHITTNVCLSTTIHDGSTSSYGHGNKEDSVAEGDGSGAGSAGMKKKAT
jgi:hypothetical protein